MYVDVSVVLICISLMAGDVEHLFMCCLLSAFSFSSVEMSVYVFCPLSN